MNTKHPLRKIKERYVWGGAGLLMLIIMCFAVVVPNAVAQSQESGQESKRLLSVFEDVYRFVLNNYVDQVDADTLMEGALDGMFESLDDPYSDYLTKEEMEDLNDTTTGKFGGVGMYISKYNPPEDDPEALPAYIEIISPIEDTPAYRAGIHAGDFIMKIEEESTKPLSIDEVQSRLRGEPGTEVTITILRNRKITKEVTLTRAVIEIPTVKQAMIKDDIAYLRIIQFTPYTPSRVREAITFFEKEGYEHMIIDVRSNPGGLLNSVINTADLFLSEGMIVSTKSRVPSENAQYTGNKFTAVQQSLPIYVLVDKGTASAAEILAGALRDRDRAVVVGRTTYGKGSVQQVHSFSQGGFKLTMARYYTPSGKNIDKVGIKPDVVVEEPELTEEQLEDYNSLLEHRYIERFVADNTDPKNKEIDQFIKRLEEKEIELPERIVKRLVKNEVNRLMEDSPIYNLEYDTILEKTVQMIEDGNGVNDGNSGN